MIEQLLDRFDAIYPLSDGLIARIKNIVLFKQCTKRALLLHEGMVAKEMIYVHTGLVRVFSRPNDTEVTTKFLMAGQFLTSWPSFYRQQPSQEYIEALEDLELTAFPHTPLQQVYNDFPEFNFIARSFYENHLLLAEERNAMLRCENADKKYAFFLQHYSAIANRVPLKYIASYLGITKETLSRTRARLQRKS